MSGAELPSASLANSPADVLQHRADQLTAFREKSAPFVGAAVALTSENWAVTIAGSVSAATDFFDGVLARKARAVRGYDLPTGGSETDPRADHKFIQSLLGGLTIRQLVRRKWTEAWLFSTLQAFTNARDDRMDLNRQRINDLGIDQRELGANWWNRIKMAAVCAGSLGLISPLGRYPAVRRLAWTSLVAGTVSGVVGERKFRMKVNRLEAEATAAEAVTATEAIDDQVN